MARTKKEPTDAQRQRESERFQRLLSGESKRKAERFARRFWLIFVIIVVLGITGIGSQLLGGSRLGTWLFGCPDHQTQTTSGQCMKVDPNKNSGIPDNCLDPACTGP
jgi:hypothetical protein